MVSENTTKYHQVPYSFRYPPVGLVLTISSSTMKWFDNITSISSIFTLYSSYPLPVVHIWVHLYISITTFVSSCHWTSFSLVWVVLFASLYTFLGVLVCLFSSTIILVFFHYLWWWIDRLLYVIIPMHFVLLSYTCHRVVSYRLSNSLVHTSISLIVS